MEQPPTVMLVAGEASGDQHAADLVRALKRIHPQLHCFGMGGQRMAQAGVEILIDSSELAVVGIVEVLVHYPALRGALRKLQTCLRSRRPDLLILIDYPEFNLKLASVAKRAGVKVLYYISPQVWAWRQGRVKKIRRRVDHMAVVFPFEADFYRQNGVPVTYVGHPLVDNISISMDRQTACKVFSLDHNAPVIGLFPGSRKNEIERLMPAMVSTASRLTSRFLDLQFILPLASSHHEREVNDFLRDQSVNVHIVNGNIYDAIQACDVILTASGTVTLQIALMETPMTVLYRLAPLTYWLVRRLVTLKEISLVNIVAGKTIVREFLQDAVKPEDIADEVSKLLEDKTYADTMRHELACLRQRLGEGGTADKVAQIASRMLKNQSYSRPV